MVTNEFSFQLYNLITEVVRNSPLRIIQSNSTKSLYDHFLQYTSAHDKPKSFNTTWQNDRTYLYMYLISTFIYATSTHASRICVYMATRVLIHRYICSHTHVHVFVRSPRAMIAHARMCLCARDRESEDVGEAGVMRNICQRQSSRFITVVRARAREWERERDREREAHARIYALGLRATSPVTTTTLTPLPPFRKASAHTQTRVYTRITSLSASCHLRPLRTSLLMNPRVCPRTGQLTCIRLHNPPVWCAFACTCVCVCVSALISASVSGAHDVYLSPRCIFGAVPGAFRSISPGKDNARVCISRCCCCCCCCYWCTVEVPVCIPPQSAKWKGRLYSARTRWDSLRERARVRLLSLSQFFTRAYVRCVPGLGNVGRRVYRGCGDVVQRYLSIG